jgi:hypothetical protein
VGERWVVTPWNTSTIALTATTATTIWVRYRTHGKVISRLRIVINFNRE